MSVISTIYSYRDYREYLTFALSTEEWGRGARQALAKYLNCGASFISQVLNGKNDLSLEHAFKVSQFLQHDEGEHDFFMLMVQMGKAGSYELEQYFLKQLEDLKKKQLQIKNLVKNQELSKDDVLRFFGNWYCICIHSLIAIEEYQVLDKLKEKLGANDQDFKEAMDFLQQTNLIKVEGDRVKTGEAHIMLTKDSPYAQAASVSTRLKILEVLKVRDPNSVNLSANFTISAKSYEQLRQDILEVVGKLNGLVSDGRAEKFCTLVIDLVEH